jgi:hypothetical protein
VRTNTILSVFSTELGPGLSALSRASWKRQALRYALGLVLLLRFRSVSQQLYRPRFLGHEFSLADRGMSSHFRC